MKKLLKMTEIVTLPKSVQFPNCQGYRTQILIAQIEDLKENCVKISRPYFLYLKRNKSSKRITLGPSRVGSVHRSSSSFSQSENGHTNLFSFFQIFLKFQRCFNVITRKEFNLKLKRSCQYDHNPLNFSILEGTEMQFSACKRHAITS